MNDSERNTENSSAAPLPFFITGGTLPLTAPSYVARAADDELFQSLQRGEFCYVLNTRQMGKSSLMIRTARRLREAGKQVLILDLTGVGQNLTVDQWYFGLLDLAAAQTGHDAELFAFWAAHKELGAMQRFVAALRRVLLASPTEGSAARDVVIFVDEIDAVRSLPFSADEFFAGIRECCNRNAQESEGARLTFCLLGVATPSDLIRDTRVTPFNIGHRIELHDFTQQEAAPLALGLQIHRTALEAEALLERVLYWTGGQPYMTQRLCRAVAEYLAGSGEGGGSDAIEDAALVDGLCQYLFLTKSARETDDNLAFVRTRLLHSETDRVALLDLYGQVRRGKRVQSDETNPLCPVLRLSGVVKEENGWLVLRNAIYARVFDTAWIAEHMPDAEVQRQKRAYRRGVLRTAAVAMLLLAVISGFGVRAYVAEQKARTAAKMAQAARNLAQNTAEHSNRLLYATQMNLLQRAYQEDNIVRARDLLAETADSPYRGFEWHYWNRLLTRERLAIPVSEPQSLIVWSRDKRWIVTQTQSTLEMPRLSLWDARTGSLVRTLAGRTDALQGVASPISATCVALVDAPQGQSGTVRLVNPTTGATQHELPVRAAGATLSGDGKQVFTLEPQPNARTLFKMWDVARGTLLFSTTINSAQVFGTMMQTSTVQAVRDAQLLCFGSSYGRDNCPLTLLDTVSGKRLWTPSEAYCNYGLSPSGRFLVVSKANYDSADFCYVWDLQKKQEIARLNGNHRDRYENAPTGSYLIYNLRFSPDERWIVGAGRGNQSDGRIWLWNTATGKEERVLHGHRKIVFTAEFSQDGHRLFTTARDNSLRIWNTATWETIGVYSNDSTTPPALSPDGRELVTVDRHAVLVYPIEKRRVADKLRIPGAKYMQFCPDNQHVQIIRWTPRDPKQTKPDQQSVYDMATGIERRLPFKAWQGITLGGNAHAVNYDSLPQGGMQFEIRDALTGKLNSMIRSSSTFAWMRSDWPELAIITYDGKIPLEALAPQTLLEHGPQVVVWNMETGKEILHLPRLSYIPRRVEVKHSAQKLIVVDTENVAHLWSMRTQRELSQIALGGEKQWRAGILSLSPDGRYVSVLISENHFNGRIEVYDAQTGKRCAQNEHAIFFQPTDAFSPDGRYRIWADTHQNVHIMDGPTGKELRVLKSVGGDFTNAVFSPDSSRLVTNSNVGMLKLWDVETASELMTLTKQEDMIQPFFSPDGTRLLAATVMTEPAYGAIWDARPLGATGTRKK